jgi:plasmid stabilization system protein ParE
MHNIVILPLAKQDIKEAADWYNSRQKGLGKKFTFQIRETLNLLKKTPYNSAIRYDDVRTAILNVFPFMIHYTIHKSNKQIIISAVLHTSRNPDLWKTNREDY